MTKIRFLFRLSLLSILIGATSCLLASTAMAEEYVSVVKDGVNIRSGPDTTKEILWTVFKGFPLQVTDQQGNWSKVVDYEGDTGWIASSLLAKEKTLIVKVETANLRVGAGIDYELVASAKHGVVFKPLETEGDWVKVKHADGTTGWVASRLLWPN
ncbi:SH3 domain-containing protein [Thiovibrio frasassiensis]|jgi:SH3-like domain-containing protein|uniref:SH3 domain-containing protein n=1 Tax=Thiovibrio frasassiensis TaxID=2984131 RepID=A0A9X4RKG3_9BACT|nr:SH3 domain-containing protein [Thiovibrio frasassiensis]MDG4474609.1 SH3 domain-containing protein [Thiovibrio frasassiensis]